MFTVRAAKALAVYFYRNYLKQYYTYCLIAKPGKFMKIILDIQKVKTLFEHSRALKIKVKIGEYLVISTQTTYLKNSCFSFLEKHTLLIDNNDALYLQIILLTETNQILAQITKFFSEFKSQSHVTFTGPQQSQYTLFYEVRELQSVLLAQKTIKANKSSSSILSDSTFIEQELGLLLYHFLSKLGPLVTICTSVKNIICWKNPFITTFVGVMLNLMILYPKMSLFFGGLLLYCCRNFIIKKLQKIQQYDINVHKSLPEENTLFLQSLMQLYCEIYEKITQFIFKHDKTYLLYIINIICKAGGLIILLLFAFSVTHLVLIVLWTTLLATSPLKETIQGYATPFCLTFVTQYAKIMDNITNSLQKMLIKESKVNIGQALRQFYFYHYERWGLLDRWHDDDLKYSDKEFECVAMMKKNPPIGWQWIQNWQIDYQQNSDQDGYQYSNDFLNEFTQFLLISNRRRRRWRRCCIKTKSL